MFVMSNGCLCRVCYCQHCPAGEDRTCADCEVGQHRFIPKGNTNKTNRMRKLSEIKKLGFFIGKKQIYDPLSGRVRNPDKE